MNKKKYLIFGILSPLCFWITTFLCAAVLGDYNHFRYLVSELGALGTETQIIFSVGLVLSSICNILFVVGLNKVLREEKLSRIPLFFIAMFSFIAGPGVVPMPLPLHNVIGMPMILIVFAPVSVAIFWPKEKEKNNYSFAVISSSFFMLLGFLVYFPNVLEGFFGLKQRFLYTGWTIWSVFLSLRFLSLYKQSLLNAN